MQQDRAPRRRAAANGPTVAFSGAVTLSTPLENQPMLTIQRIELRCPVCEARFESYKPLVTSGADDTQEQSVITSNAAALPYLVHVCDGCGYAGELDDYDADIEISPVVRAHVWSELAPRLPFATRNDPARRMPASEKYESAAKVAEWQWADGRHVGGYWLRAAWCAGNEGDHEAERYYRRHAVWWFTQALGRFDDVPADERATITFLLGELWREIGDVRRATEWFSRVPEEIVELDAQRSLLDAARRQLELPDEWLT
jgi:uncharacterized protein